MCLSISLHPAPILSLPSFLYKTLVLRVLLRHIHVIPDILWDGGGLNLTHGYADLGHNFHQKTFSPGKYILSLSLL